MDKILIEGQICSHNIVIDYRKNTIKFRLKNLNQFEEKIGENLRKFWENGLNKR